MGRRKSSGKKANVTKAKSTQKKARKGRNVDTETDVSGDLTIHDSESDDLEESFSKLKCN